MPDSKVIGARLRALRGNMTQTFLAKLLGVSPSSINMYETGERTPSDKIKVKYVEVFGHSVQSIFFDM